MISLPSIPSLISLLALPTFLLSTTITNILTIEDCLNSITTSDLITNPTKEETGVTNLCRSTNGSHNTTAKPFTSELSSNPSTYTADIPKREAIKAEFLHGYHAYKRDAWGYDDYHPITQRGSNGMGLSWTMIDSLSTLYIMNLTEDIRDAQEFLRENLRFDGIGQGGGMKQDDVSVFESTIRVLGGLLSAYALSGETEKLFLDKAIEVADQLSVAFEKHGDTTGLPLSSVDFSGGGHDIDDYDYTSRRNNQDTVDNNFIFLISKTSQWIKTAHKATTQGSSKSATAHMPRWAEGASVSEVGTLQLEWRYLSHVTNNPKYAEYVDSITNTLSKVHFPNETQGLFTRFIDPANGNLVDKYVTLGARVDSVYEYFLKAFLQSDSTDALNRELYELFIERIIDSLVVGGNNTNSEGSVYFQEIINGNPSPKMDHLVCFMGGLLALGSQTLFENDVHKAQTHLALAEQITQTCVNMYDITPTGLAPEIVRFTTSSDEDNEDNGGVMYVDPGAKHNLLRPETVESLFVLHRITHKPIYREMAWQIFNSFRDVCRIPTGGYSGIMDVTKVKFSSNNEEHNDDVSVPDAQYYTDHMESFFLAETMKYLYLIFDDESNISLDDWVLNTEAHPLPILR